jgi:hypothetical protein
MNTEKKKKSTGKRILKWVVSILLILIIALFSIPFLFKDKIVEMVSNTINNNVNATVTFTEANLSLLKNFPQASITVTDITVANKAPFLGDTLYTAKELSLSMKITELFKNADEVLELKSIATKNGQVNIIHNKQGIGNYDIGVPEKTVVKEVENNEPFSFKIKDYQLENIDFKFVDQSANLVLKLENIHHSGKGNFAQEVLDLDTKTTAILSLDADKANYMHDVAISLNAVLGIDLKNSKYTFKENTGYINQLPLEFNGFVQLLDDSQLYDISFKTPNPTFKNLLALLPKQYSGNLNAIKTAGNFDLTGVVKGTLSESRIPAFDISFSSKNAMFKYDELPKSVENIHIDTKIINKTGDLKDTYINLNKLTFKVDEDVFSANGNIARVTTNPKIDLTAKGTINLANISKVYPALEKELSGILTADISTSFDMNAIDKGNYESIKNAGEINMSDFKYDDKDVANPFYIQQTGITFNTNSIKLNKFDAKTGDSDVSITGNLDNFYGFLFKNQVLKGNFSLSSNIFKVSDFLTDEETTENKEVEASGQLKIPAFLDCTFYADAKSVTYDNINLKNVSGTMYVKDEAVLLKDIKSDVFGGNIGFTGKVSTKGDTSNFDMDLNLKELNISESFSNLEMLKSIAPIAKTIEGKINSTVNVSGNLNEDFTPNLKSVSGDLFGKLLNPKVNRNNSKVLSLLGDKVSFLDTDKLNLDGINALLSFENGNVNVKPIPLKYKDIGVLVSGSHSFDNAMNYDIVFDVPVKYLGTEVTNLIAKLTPTDAASVKSVPVKGTLTGSFGSPSFSSNMKDATATLMKDLVEKQKNSLLNQGKDKLKNLIGIGDTKKDTTQQESPKDKVTDKVKDVLGGLFGKKKKN